MIEGVMTAKPQVMAAAVKWAAKFLAAKPVVPIQAGMRLEMGGGSLSISVYNENVSARAMIEVGGDATGVVVVSGRLLAELVGTFPDKEVRIEAEDTTSLSIAAGRWTGSLPCMADEDFPELTVAVPTIGEVSGTEFADMVARVAVAAHDDITKQTALACVCLVIGDRQIQAYATDTYRIAGSSVPYAGDAVEGFTLVPAHALSDVAAAFIGPDDVRIGYDHGSVSLTSATRSVALRQIKDQYPLLAGIEQILPEVQPCVAEASVSDLMGAMKRAALMSEKKPIVLRFDTGSIVVDADGGDTRKHSAEEIDAAYEGEVYEAVFNAGYLGELLGSTPGDRVRINFTPVTGRTRPKGFAMSAPGNDRWRHMLMPIKKSS